MTDHEPPSPEHTVEPGRGGVGEKRSIVGLGTG